MKSLLLAIGAAAVTLGATFPLTAKGEAKSATLSCSGYTGTTALANFQTLVKLSEGVYGFSYADSNGSDIWFEDSSGNVIPHEVDAWNADGESFVWVKIPEVLPSGNANFPTTFTMHWGDAAEKATHPCTTSDTWNGFAGVWHMNGMVVGGTAQNEPDATGHSLDAVPTVNYGTGDLSAMTRTTGIVGNGRINQTADACVQGLKVPDYSSYVTDASKFTISGWWSATALNMYPRFASAEGSPSYWAIVGYDHDGSNINRWKKIQGIYSNGDKNNGGSVTSTFEIDSFQSPNWVYLTVVWDGTTLTAYSNGAQKYQNKKMVAQTLLDSGFMIGGDSAAATINPAWRGYYDEVRMYDGVQSADRVKADYDTMNSPHSFLNWKMSAGSSYTLVQDTDWLVPNTDVMIDMNGYNLTLADGFGGAAMITNSAAGEAKELRVSFASAAENTATAIGGNLVFVKDGAGTFTSSKAQTYTGGTIVEAGTAQPPARTAANDLTHTWDNFKAFGTGEITVNTGGTFDVRGQYGYRNIITLNGGTWKCSGFTGRDDTRNDFPGVKRLTADSFITVSQSCMFGNTGNDDLLDLDGHTLTVTVDSSGVYFNSKNSFFGNPGTMVLNGAGWGISIPQDTTIWATTVTFRVGARVNLGKNVQFHMLDYIAEHTVNNLYAYSGSQLYVYGTFKPNAANNYFVGPQMQNNSTVDLSDMSGPWSSKSGGSSLTTCKYVTFADGATVYVKVGSRELDKDAALVTWDSTSKPTNLSTLRFVFADGTYAGRELSKRGAGLYPTRKGLIISFF